MIYEKYLWRTDSAGYINNELKLPRLPYKTILNEIVKSLKNIGRNLISIFLRGSAAFDNVEMGISDLDLIVVVKRKDEETLNLIKKLSKYYSVQYKQYFCEISIASFEESYFISDEFSFFSKFVIKTQSICLYGINYSASIEKIPLNHKIYSLDISYCRNKLQIFDNNINSLKSDEKEKISYLCRHISKYLIRTIFAILASQQRPLQYSRDIRCCFEIINLESPVWANRLNTFYKWVRCPTDNLELLTQKFKNLAPLIKSECQIWLENKERKKSIE